MMSTPPAPRPRSSTKDVSRDPAAWCTLAELRRSCLLDGPPAVATATDPMDRMTYMGLGRG